MLSKLTAQLAIIAFVIFTFVAILLKYIIGLDFSMAIYFQYLLLLCISIVILGRPFVKLALDLVNIPFRQNIDHFKIPGSEIQKGSDKPKA